MNRLPLFLLTVWVVLVAAAIHDWLDIAELSLWHSFGVAGVSLFGVLLSWWVVDFWMNTD